MFSMVELKTPGYQSILVNLQQYLNNAVEILKVNVLNGIDSLGVECWRPVQLVQGSIPDKGQRHTKGVKKWYQWFSCLALNIKMATLALSQKANSKKQ